MHADETNWPNLEVLVEVVVADGDACNTVDLLHCEQPQITLLTLSVVDLLVQEVGHAERAEARFWLFGFAKRDTAKDKGYRKQRAHCKHPLTLLAGAGSPHGEHRFI